MIDYLLEANIFLVEFPVLISFFKKLKMNFLTFMISYCEFNNRKEFKNYY